MNLIDNVTINNLWGSGRSITLNFDKSKNFLIGGNGSGKTTILNLISSALVGNFEMLSKIDFDKITINLQHSTQNKKPSIEVTKNPNPINLTDTFIYVIRWSQKGQQIEIQFNDFDIERFLRFGYRNKERLKKNAYAELEIYLNELVNICLLSVHRFGDSRREIDDHDEFDIKRAPAIDRKIQTLNIALTSYFSSLAKKYADKITEFQKNILLSVLTPDSSSAISAFSNAVDLTSEKNSLAEMFEVLGVEQRNYEPKLRSHFEKFQHAQREKKHGGLTLEMFAALYNTWRGHELIKEFNQLQENKKEIFKPRDSFIDVLNSLLNPRKVVYISDGNKLCFKTAIGRNIELEDLSSGEKQLLIILGEAVLQRNQHCIYIADEPELSLHISWQEALTRSISKLNKNAQIIFATHSPDIVSSNQENIIQIDGV